MASQEQFRTRDGITYLRFLPDNFDSQKAYNTFAFFQGFGVDNVNYPNPEGFCKKFADAGHPLYVFFSPGFAGSSGRRAYIDEETSSRRMTSAHEILLGDCDGVSKKNLVEVYHSLACGEGARYLDICNGRNHVKGAVFLAPYTTLDELLSDHPVWAGLFSIADYVPKWLPVPYLFANPKYHSRDGKIGAKKWIKAKDGVFTRNLKTYEHTTKLAGLPMLFVIPREDHVVSAKRQEALAGCTMFRNNCAEPVWIKGARHNLMLDAPEETFKRVMDWYSRLKA